MKPLKSFPHQVSSLVFLLTAGALVGCAGTTSLAERRERDREVMDVWERMDSVLEIMEGYLRAPEYLRSSWVKEGGEVNPLGQVEPILFRRIGWAPNRIPEPYSEATSVLTIGCNQMPPPLVVSVRNAPRLDGLSEAVGQARIDDGPLHPVKWQDAGSRIIATVLAGAERLIDPNFADLRDPMQAGDTLTVSAPTSVGAIFFRFVLEGLEAQTDQCSADSPEVVMPDTLTVTKSLR